MRTLLSFARYVISNEDMRELLRKITILEIGEQYSRESSLSPTEGHQVSGDLARSSFLRNMGCHHIVGMDVKTKRVQVIS